jgi:hypothetical protein
VQGGEAAKPLPEQMAMVTLPDDTLRKEICMEVALAEPAKRMIIYDSYGVDAWGEAYGSAQYDEYEKDEIPFASLYMYEIDSDQQLTSVSGRDSKGKHKRKGHKVKQQKTPCARTYTRRRSGGGRICPTHRE